MKQNNQIETMEDWSKTKDKAIVQKTIDALKANGINGHFAKNEDEVKRIVFDLIPKGSEVMTMTSVTLDSLGIPKLIDESGDYKSVRKKLMSMDRNKDGREMQKLGAAPDFTIGSVHAVSEDGKLIIASNTGSQLPAYSYGSGHVIWVVGTQKIVKDLDDGMNRVYEYVLPKESERAHKAYGVPGSFVSKLLIINREIQLDRMHVIFVDQAVGY